MSTSSGSHNSSPTTSPKSPTTTETTAEPPTTTVETTTDPPSVDPPRPSRSSSPTKAQAAIDSLSAILPTPLHSLSSSRHPSAAFLLTSPDVSSQISTLLRHPSSGAGDNPLCRWLYDTFQSSDPSLQLVVLRFIPLISGLYLSRVLSQQKHPLAGFEAVLLALYAHETTSRNGQAISVTVPDLSNPSVYHECNATHLRNNSTDLNIAVISSSLEPHGTVRSSRRARIVGVAMELFYSKIWVMPVESKLDFCEFLDLWAGGGEERKGEEAGAEIGTGERRIPLPWELLQPCLRILGHCLLGESEGYGDSKGKGKGELHEKACRACKSLYERALHDVNPKAILAAGSLLKLVPMEGEASVDHTEIHANRIISI